MNGPTRPLAVDDFLRASARVPEHVIYRSFGSETVLLNLQTGHYHGLNPTGGRLMELLEETKGQVAEAVDRLAGEYGESSADIAPDLADFCAQLEERGLLEIDAPGRD
jgi:hypothetical protein